MKNWAVHDPLNQKTVSARTASSLHLPLSETSYSDERYSNYISKSQSGFEHLQDCATGSRMPSSHFLHFGKLATVMFTAIQLTSKNHLLRLGMYLLQVRAFVQHIIAGRKSSRTFDFKMQLLIGVARILTPGVQCHHRQCRTMRSE